MKKNMNFKCYLILKKVKTKKMDFFNWQFYLYIKWGIADRWINLTFISLSILLFFLIIWGVSLYFFPPFFLSLTKWDKSDKFLYFLYFHFLSFHIISKPTKGYQHVVGLTSNGLESLKQVVRDLTSGSCV